MQRVRYISTIQFNMSHILTSHDPPSFVANGMPAQSSTVTRKSCMNQSLYLAPADRNELSISVWNYHYSSSQNSLSGRWISTLLSRFGGCAGTRTGLSFRRHCSKRWYPGASGVQLVHENSTCACKDDIRIGSSSGIQDDFNTCRYDKNHTTNPRTSGLGYPQEEGRQLSKQR